jgi:S-formylglutathione hydrolase FrmB
LRRALLAAAVVLASATSAHASTLVTWDTSSHAVDGSPFNDRPRTSQLPVNVLLPDGWSRKRAYPVLYLLHGHGDAFDSWATPQNGDLLHIAAGFRGIVVMPEGGRGWYTNWWAGPAWQTYHLDELIPLVEKRLKIAPGRANHAVAGLSMGGEGAMYYASQRPGYFGAVASFSGVL